MREVEIKDVAAMRIAGIEHRGPYTEIGRAFDRLHGLMGQLNLYRPDQTFVAIYFNDPSQTPAAELRSVAGMSVAAQTAVEPPLKLFDVASGPCAVLRHLGPYAELGAAWDWLYAIWLPQSGRAAAHRPSTEIYINTPMTAAPKDLITDIRLPLR